MGMMGPPMGPPMGAGMGAPGMGAPIGMRPPMMTGPPPAKMARK